MLKTKELDWLAIKTEYVSTDIGYRALAKKWGVAEKTLAGRGKAEKWVEARQQYKDKRLAKALDSQIKSSQKYRDTLYDLAYKVASDLVKMTNDHNMSELIALGIKPRDITGAIRDLKDSLDIKSDIDIKEQEQRIANLRKQVESSDEDKSIKVTISADAADYAK